MVLAVVSAFVGQERGVFVIASTKLGAATVIYIFHLCLHLSSDFFRFELLISDFSTILNLSSDVRLLEALWRRPRSSSRSPGEARSFLRCLGKVLWEKLWLNCRLPLATSPNQLPKNQFFQTAYRSVRGMVRNHEVFKLFYVFFFFFFFFARFLPPNIIQTWPWDGSNRARRFGSVGGTPKLGS